MVIDSPVSTQEVPVPDCLVLYCIELAERTAPVPAK